MNPYPNLLSPKKVGKILFKNRIFTAPTGVPFTLIGDCKKVATVQQAVRSAFDVAMTL